MPRAPRVMRLTAGHVQRVHRDIADPGPGVHTTATVRPATDADYDAHVAQMLATRPDGGFWLFAYGSLIWNPATAFVERRIATVRGWHRRFCLGWDYRYRGSLESPGLMLALDRGGQCTGAAYRLPDADLETELQALIRREMSMVPSAFPWRWLEVLTGRGPVRALTFAMDRRHERYIAGLSEAETVDMLATACGFRGSMAEYLFSTVAKLEELGIHDRNLWRLQALVADRIDATHPTEH